MPDASDRYEAILNAIREASLAVRTSAPRRPGLLEQGLIIEAYGSLLRLESLVPAARESLTQPRELRRSDDRSLEPTDSPRLLLDELLRFFQSVGRLNAALVDIYYPGLASRLREAYSYDIEITHFFADHVEPHYKIQAQHRALIDAILDTQKAEWYDYRHYGRYRFDRSEENGSKLLEAVEHLLPDCKSELGQMIREHWELRDFVERVADVKIEIGSIDASAGRISLGDGAQVQGGIVSAVSSTVSVGTPTTHESDAQAELLRQLTSAIAELKGRLPAPVARQVETDLRRLEEEAALAHPRRAWYELTVSGLKEALSAVGAIAAPAMAIADQILSILSKRGAT
jgi:hypothetical protein